MIIFKNVTIGSGEDEAEDDDYMVYDMRSRMQSFAVDNCDMPPTIFLEDDDLIPTTSLEPINYKMIPTAIPNQNSPIPNVPDNFAQISNNNIDNVNGIDNYVKEFFAADNSLFRSTQDANVNLILTRIKIKG